MVGRPKDIAREYEGFTTRDAILAAAEKLAGERGASGLKIREIARLVGIEPASIYKHFKGLGAILTALIGEALAQEHLLLDLPEGVNGEAAIRELNKRTTRYLAARKGIVSLSLDDFAKAHDPTRDAFDENEAIIVQGLDIEAELISRHLGLGKLGRKRLGQIAIARRSMILVFLSVTCLNGKEVDEQREAEIADMVSAFLLGLQSQY
ncbi:TetR/AcrR family transcriptional regulator [Ruegeria atlantica]|uniref:TetR/AcrR family transcriptional regulator n=1 Tax=Ruegeria atlantica TaxID=81569 RepID=UPI00147B02BF|nr:TetR/AcrR family transcriptional regulator [Ruegeria atlantica]